jgi:hypothetical protein
LLELGEAEPRDRTGKIREGLRRLGGHTAMGWNFRGRVAPLAARLSALATVVLGAGCQNGPYLQTEQFVARDGQPEEKVGTACMSAERGSGLGGGRAPGVPGAAGEGSEEAAGYSFSYDGTGSGVRFRVVDSAGKTLAGKSYDGAFLDSGQKDEVTIEVGAEKARFVARGVPQCGS